MNSPFRRHVDQDLVRYLDGELSARQYTKVDLHLASCAQCRSELTELKNTLAECAAYEQSRMAQMPAPQAWRDLSRDFSRIDQALATDSLLVRLIRPLMHSGAFRVSFVSGLAVLIVLLSLNQLRQAPSVQAATILRKAEQIAQTKPRPAHRIRVRTSRQQEFTRPGVAEALQQVAQAQAVADMFQAAHFDWSDPLSAQTFDQWRSQQVHKTDEVSTVHDHFTQVRTESPDGDLAAASITFDTEEYPVEERLEFRDQQWVELSEIAETYTESAGGTVAHVEAPGRAAEPPSRPTAFAPPSASISDELLALSKISAIGADLGDPVDVTLSDGKVKVVGFEGLSSRRQSDIRTALADVPHVEVEFGSSAPAPRPADISANATGSASVPANPVETRLEKHLGGLAQFEHFSSTLLDLDEQAMDRVYAIRRLAEKFSSEDESRLSPNDIALLHELTRKHTAVLAEKIGEMERLMVPALTALGGTAASVPPASRSTWQPAAEDLFTHARRVEVLVSQMLGVTSSTVSTNALPSDLLTALKQLRGNLDECQKAVGK